MLVIVNKIWHWCKRIYTSNMNFMEILIMWRTFVSFAELLQQLHCCYQAGISVIFCKTTACKNSALEIQQKKVSDKCFKFVWQIKSRVPYSKDFQILIFHPGLQLSGRYEELWFAPFHKNKAVKRQSLWHHKGLFYVVL